jgi:predicted kinase
MATLHFVFGKPAAGKTTLARALATDLGGVLFVEDEWLAAIAPTPITDLAGYLDVSGRARRLIGPLATRLLELGLTVVLDFAGNTRRDRAWVRGLADAAGATHLLHVLDVDDAECKRRLAERNRTRPPGLYFGDVSEDLFDQIVPHITLPADDEGIVSVRG